jgi:hypothetical protein
MAMLEHALARHFHDCVSAACSHCPPQESLEEKTPRHGHFVHVTLVRVGDTEAYGACRRNAVPSGA